MWERVPDDNGCVTERMEVPGGWLVRIVYIGCGNVAVTFYPDPAHAWTLNEKPAVKPTN